MAQQCRRRIRVRTGYLRCSACGRDLPEDDFYLKAGRRSSHCRPCEIARSAARHKARYATDPVFRETEKRRVRTWKRRHPADGASWQRMRVHAARRHLARLKAAGWGLRRVARAIGRSKSTVRAWREGTCAPRTESLRRLRALADAVAPE
jgi:ribosome-binding protein aMBF1 (putative translation factor)